MCSVVGLWCSILSFVVESNGMGSNFSYFDLMIFLFFWVVVVLFWFFWGGGCLPL